jgi:hypothetical protein
MNGNTPPALPKWCGSDCAEPRFILFYQIDLYYTGIKICLSRKYFIDKQGHCIKKILIEMISQNVINIRCMNFCSLFFSKGWKHAEDCAIFPVQSGSQQKGT